MRRENRLLSSGGDPLADRSVLGIRPRPGPQADSSAFPLSMRAMRARFLHSICTTVPRERREFRYGLFGAFGEEETREKRCGRLLPLWRRSRPRNIESHPRRQVIPVDPESACNEMCSTQEKPLLFRLRA